jgi:hypothetical protein
MCRAFVASMEARGLFRTVKAAAGGDFGVPFMGGDHVVGAWVAHATDALSWDPADVIGASNAANAAAFAANPAFEGNPPLHSFMWYAMARVEARAFWEVAASLRATMYKGGVIRNADLINGLHGIGHGALLNALLRADAHVRKCFTPCSPLRLFSSGSQYLSRAVVGDAYRLCMRGPTPYWRARCKGGASHFAAQILAPASASDVEGLCDVEPEDEVPMWPGAPIAQHSTARHSSA